MSTISWRRLSLATTCDLEWVLHNGEEGGKRIMRPLNHCHGPLRISICFVSGDESRSLVLNEQALTLRTHLESVKWHYLFLVCLVSKF